MRRQQKDILINKLNDTTDKTSCQYKSCEQELNKIIDYENKLKMMQFKIEEYDDKEYINHSIKLAERKPKVGINKL